MIFYVPNHLCPNFSFSQFCALIHLLINLQVHVLKSGQSYLPTRTGINFFPFLCDRLCWCRRGIRARTWSYVLVTSGTSSGCDPRPQVCILVWSSVRLRVSESWECAQHTLVPPSDGWITFANPESLKGLSGPYFVFVAQQDTLLYLKKPATNILCDTSP